tara:strand:- start:223 stop:1020 length:798 start_codon:yes stop_codon:yes gene_type:complete
MYPILFEFRGFMISSFGAMMVVAFMVGNYCLRKDYLKIKKDPNIADDLTFNAAIGGIIGAKVYYLIENIPTGHALDNLNGLLNIIKGIFTLSLSTISMGIQSFGAGMVYWGGFIGGTIAVTVYIKKNKLEWFDTADMIAPYLVLCHGIGRIGCFLVGDDYGIPTSLPWGISFPNGIPPTIVPVHPTQIYEMIIYFMIYKYLKNRTQKRTFSGEIISEYLFLAGISRFLVEFIRTNPKYLLGFSSAQYVSIIMMAIGSYFLWKNRR